MKTLMCIAGLACVAGAASAGPTNLLTNGGFEDFNPFENGFPGWPIRFGNVFQDPSADIPAFEGVSSAKMFGGFFGPCAQSDGGLIQDVSVPDAAGKTFRLSVMVYSPTGDSITPLDESDPNGCTGIGVPLFGHIPVFIMDFKDANGTTLASVSDDQFLRFGFPVLDEWLEWTLEGVAPAGTVTVTAFPLLVQFGFAGGAMYWDDMKLQEVETGPVPCNVADVAADFGVLNVNDIVDFVNGFNGGNAIADVSPPGGDGLLNVNDIVDFVNAFNAGCP